MLLSRGTIPDRISTAPGDRIYAIGDIHGRWDLLGRMLDTIARHDERRPRQERSLILITGDVIDRGPQSRECLAAARLLCQSGAGRCLVGNHEAMLLDAIEGNFGAQRVWLRNGGLETLASFGINQDRIIADPKEFGRRLAASIPEEDIEFLRSLPLSHQSGDYLFVHAGVRPGVKLHRQAAADMMWVRDEFLNDERWHGAMVVHGHSIVPNVEFRPNRIAIDTEAWRSGLLSCVMFEDDVRSVLTVQDG